MDDHLDKLVVDMPSYLRSSFSVYGELTKIEAALAGYIIMIDLLGGACYTRESARVWAICLPEPPEK